MKPDYITQIMEGILRTKNLTQLAPFKKELESICEGFEEGLSTLAVQLLTQQNAKKYDEDLIKELQEQITTMDMVYRYMCRLFNYTEIREQKLSR